MPIGKLNFTKNWNSAADFPTYEEDEAAVRADLQLLHDETRAFVNTMAEKVDELDTGLDRTAINNHLVSAANPHGVTAAQVGLGNVPNVTTNNQTPTYTAASTLTGLTSGETLSAALGKIAKAVADLIAHIANKSNPHAVTKAQVGLGNADNTADAAKSVAKAAQLTTARTIQTNLGSTTAASFNGSANVAPGVTGVLPAGNGGTGYTSLQAARKAMGLGDTSGALPVANGGTGLTASPSMLTNLGSTTADNVLKASPRPGVTGTLLPANGGTGQTSLQAARNAMGLGNTTGALPVANGGTGLATMSYKNAVPIGNSATVNAALQAVRTGNGAFYATAQDAKPAFGTLPPGQGGTGCTSLQAARNAMGLGNTLGALPVANGGTGSTKPADARAALGITTGTISDWKNIVISYVNSQNVLSPESFTFDAAPSLVVMMTGFASNFNYWYYPFIIRPGASKSVRVNNMEQAGEDPYFRVTLSGKTLTFTNSSTHNCSGNFYFFAVY